MMIDLAFKTDQGRKICTSCRERGSHARGVYLTQDASRMGTARVKQEEGADTRIIAKEEKINMEERKVGTKGKSPKQGLTSAQILNKT